MDKKLFIAVLIVVLAAVGAYLLLQNPKQNINVGGSMQTAPQKQQDNTNKSNLYFPISNYVNRLTFRWYGKLVTPSEKASPCGAPFSGYHTGDDLEIQSGEQNTNVPVYSISNGKIIEKGTVSGYGGLIVLSTNISGADYTVYYGHVNLATSKLKRGDSVSPGQFLADLGAACSAETSGERKHLHFAVRKGTAIDVRGYVPTTAELSNWINPKEFLTASKANIK